MTLIASPVSVFARVPAIPKDCLSVAKQTSTCCLVAPTAGPPLRCQHDADERLWVPQASDVSFRPLLLLMSQGHFVNLLRVRKTGILSRHRHAGPVHAMTLKGR